MTEKKKPEVLEGEVVRKSGSRDEPQKSSSRQYVTERGVGFGVLFLVILSIIYLAYGPVKEWLTGASTEDTKPQVSANKNETEPLAEPEQGTTENPADLDALEARIGGIEENEASLSKRLDALENDIAALQQVPSGTGEANDANNRLAALENDVAVLRKELAKKQTASGQGPGDTFAGAVSGLAPPLYQSLPYEGELERVRVLILEMPALDQATLSDSIAILSKFSKSGISDLSEIKSKFSTASIEALKVEGVPADAGWWQRTWARLKSIIVIRRTDGTGGTPLDDVISNAMAYLDRGDVKNAVSLVGGLPEPERGAFKEWLAISEERVRVLAAFDHLVSYIPRKSAGQ